MLQQSSVGGESFHSPRTETGPCRPSPGRGTRMRGRAYFRVTSEVHPPEGDPTWVQVEKVYPGSARTWVLSGKVGAAKPLERRRSGGIRSPSGRRVGTTEPKVVGSNPTGCTRNRRVFAGMTKPTVPNSVLNPSESPRLHRGFFVSAWLCDTASKSAVVPRARSL